MGISVDQAAVVGVNIPARCLGLVEDGVSGVGPKDHRWVEGPSYVAPNPEDGNPATWTDLVCELCGVIQPGWTRLRAPA
jgi:hypothetical protein